MSGVYEPGGRSPLEVIVVLGVLALVLVSLLLFSRIMALFGETGSNVISRVLDVLAVQLVSGWVVAGQLGHLVLGDPAIGPSPLVGRAASYREDRIPRDHGDPILVDLI